MMDCNRIEELMPQYLEGDSSLDERQMVEDHLESCARCRESLDAFTDLEKSLGRLKTTVPSWKTVEARFVKGAHFDKRRSFAAFVFKAPFLTGLTFITFGITCFLKGNAILAALQSLGDRSAVSLGGFEQTLARWFEAFAGVNPIILMSIYGLLLISLLGASRLLLLRSARK